MHSSLRQATGRMCSTLGILWAGAGAMKELFGTHVMAGFLPPLDLQRVNEGAALFIGCCLYFVGAWLTRAPNPSPISSGDDSTADAQAQLASQYAIDDLPVSPNRSKHRV